jgi:hypothetical protein
LAEKKGLGPLIRVSSKTTEPRISGHLRN